VAAGCRNALLVAISRQAKLADFKTCLAQPIRDIGVAREAPALVGRHILGVWLHDNQPAQIKPGQHVIGSLQLIAVEINLARAFQSAGDEVPLSLSGEESGIDSGSGIMGNPFEG
jgi:hypothetical protein